MQVRILLVENNVAVCKETEAFLRNEGYEVIVAHDGEAANYKFAFNNVDLVLLNLRMPKKPGLKVLEEIRKRSRVPVIITSSLNNGVIKNKCIEAGADDFLIKPCCDKTLLKRIKVELGNRKLVDSNIWWLNDIKIDFSKNEIVKNDRTEELSGKPMKILEVLMKNEGKVVPRECIINSVYGGSKNIVDSTLNSHMSKLRGAIGKEYIKCVIGYGYRLN